MDWREIKPAALCGTPKACSGFAPSRGSRASTVTNLQTTALTRACPTARSKLAVASIVVDRRGSVWISTWEALYCRRLDGMTERYATEAGLPSQNFTTSSLLEDREGRIWLGLNNGLYQIVSEPQPNRPVVARVYTTKDGLSGNSVSCLFRSSNGRLWVGTWDALSEFLPSAEQDGQQFTK